MTGPSNFVTRAGRRLWDAAFGGGNNPVKGDDEVILYEPGPKDLDDPFHDAAAQKRVAEVIARAATHGKPKQSGDD